MSEAHHAPGWAAIDAALAPIYGEREPLHYAPPLHMAAGGNDPLDGISVYVRDDHFHFVTYGFTELYQKESDELPAPAVKVWARLLSPLKAEVLPTRAA